MNEKIAQRLKILFVKAFEFSNLDFDSIQRGMPPWDSLRHLELIIIIEKEFKIQLSPQSGIAIKDFKTAVEEIEAIIEKTR